MRYGKYKLESLFLEERVMARNEIKNQKKYNDSRIHPYSGEKSKQVETTLTYGS